jgi:hypothetical protein
MGLVQLLYPISTQNISMFYSNDCKQTLYILNMVNYDFEIMDGQSLHP